MKNNICIIRFLLISFLVLVSAQTNEAYSQAQAGSSSQWFTMNCQILDRLNDYEENPSNMEFSKYGGWKAHQTTATGFFRVEKIDGRWWAIDPEGYYYMHKALNSVNLDDFSTDEIYKLLTENGFNGLGCWSDEGIVTTLNNESPLAYCPKISFIGIYRAQRNPRIEMPVFDDEFETFANELAQGFALYKEDPYVFGYFSDNELSWKNEGLKAHLAITDPTDKNYITAVNFLSSRGKTSSNWDEDDLYAYMALMAERYYSVVSAAIRKVDPNHMYLGSRCNSTEKTLEDFMKNAGKYVDVFSTNHYSRWGARDFEIQNMVNWSGRPLMLTEFYAMHDKTDKATGAGWKVKDEESRGMFYQNFVTTTAETGCVVGWHWFKFQDDQVDVAKGIVDIDGNQYTTLLEDMKEVNNHIYDFIDYVDSQPQPSVTLIPEADAYYKGNTNYGSESELISKFSTKAPYLRETYLRFDLSSIAALSSDIYYARLKLFSINTGSEVSSYQAELVEDDNWDANSIVYSNSPDGTKILYTWSDGGDVTIDVTNELLNALDDNNKLSIRIACTLSNNKATRFGSSEHPNPIAHPKLMVYSKEVSVSTDKVVGGQDFDFYPNPAHNSLTINNAEGSRMDIFTGAGALIQQNIIVSKTQIIDVSTLPNGLYIVQLIRNGSVNSCKLIKQ
ncbi:CBM96 family carbohydrate-binding protein [Geofilum sp. OHC36d9]|uniref:CBM96 family carbohydrate-binding protein n=1 Tax=Geofilum sp. OHC36d9 TaxID=3458413 RepID=UPI0040343E31